MQLYLLITRNCNLSCNCCIRGAKENDRLNIADWEYVIQNNDLSNYTLLLTGGEPSINPDLNKIINLSYPFFKRISINTNGVISNWLDNLSHKDIHVQVSLDGTPITHNRLRNANIYQNIEKTIIKLENLNICYNISTTVNKDNYNDIPMLAKWINRFPKMAYWKVSCELPFGCSSPNKIIDYKMWNKLVEYLLDNVAFKLKIRKLFDLKLMDKYLGSSLEVLNNTKRNCGDVKNKVYVYPDLTVYPCTCLTDFPLGNLKKNTLKEICYNDSAEPFRNYTVNSSSICSKCKYLCICNGGCIGMSYHKYGELGKGDFRCPLINS